MPGFRDTLREALTKAAWAFAALGLVTVVVVPGSRLWQERHTSASGGRGSTLEVALRAGRTYDVLQRSRVTPPPPVLCPVDGRELPIVLETVAPRWPGQRISRGEFADYYVGSFGAERDETIAVSCPLRTSWTVELRQTDAERRHFYRLFLAGVSPWLVAAVLVGVASLLDPVGHRSRRDRRLGL